MITIGELNRRIEVLEREYARDEFGGVVGDWITVGRVWSKVSVTNGNENFEDNQLQGSNNVRFVMRFYPAMSIQHRIKYMDKLYEVVAIKDIQDRHRFTEVITRQLEV